MNKREAVLRFLDHDTPQSYVPAAFFLHFDPQFHRGRPAVDKHLEYFRYTGMDFVKIQYEHSFPRVPSIQRANDWAKMPLYREEFFAAPLYVVEELVKAAKAEALILMTLYSPFMCAGHASGGLISEHLRTDPENVKAGLEAVTESLIYFVKGCIARGVDGFYMSTQGGEADRFGNSPIFEQVIKPSDLILMQEIDRSCRFNILHVCDYHSGYDDLTPFLDYPGHVVNCSLQLGDTSVDSTEIARLFGRPYMGGMDRHGVIATGDQAAIRRRVEELLAGKPERFMLGADCTIPSDIDWDNIRTAIAAAHGDDER